MTAEEIRAARAALGMSRAELAGQIFCSTRSICDWENGTRPISDWFAGEIHGLLRQHERAEAAASVAVSPFLPIPAWRLMELRRGPEPVLPADTFIPDSWRDGLATDIPF